MPFALFIKGGDVADVEILAAEFGREAADPVRLQQAPHLTCEDLVITQRSGRGHCAQFLIGRGGGEKKTQPGREFPITDGASCLAGLLAAIEKGRRGQDPHEHQARWKGSERRLLRLRQRATPSLRREVDDRLALTRIGGLPLLFEPFGRREDRCPHRLEGGWLRILRRVLEELLEDIDLFQGCLTDEEQFRPEPVEFAGLVFGEDE